MDDEWICTEASSIRRGDDIAACGIGYGRHESDARAMAFKHAKEEYQRICDLSSDCRGADIYATPGRTSCSLTRDGYRCYRMVTFTPVTGTQPPDLEYAEATFTPSYGSFAGNVEEAPLGL